MEKYKYIPRSNVYEYTEIRFYKNCSQIHREVIDNIVVLYGSIRLIWVKGHADLSRTS